MYRSKMLVLNIAAGKNLKSRRNNVHAEFMLNAVDGLELHYNPQVRILQNLLVSVQLHWLMPRQNVICFKRAKCSTCMLPITS